MTRGESRRMTPVRAAAVVLGAGASRRLGTIIVTLGGGAAAIRDAVPR
ncbi:MAG: hypothetical protein JO330_18210 [Mycobacteriaceae bacterium]|nr:hypothetical protein [Mycobacteriaceae bacterium]